MAELEELYKNIRNQLYGYIFRLSGNPHVAEEVLQETFYRAAEHILLGGEDLKQSWFFTVARNLFFDHVRRQNKQMSDEGLEDTLEDQSEGPNMALERKQNGEKVRRTLEQLNESYRKILMLREFRELSYQEIAEETGMSLEQVKVTLFRARSSFKKLYERGVSDGLQGNKR